jgi:hypothetical protein
MISFARRTVVISGQVSPIDISIIREILDLLLQLTKQWSSNTTHCHPQYEQKPINVDIFSLEHAIPKVSVLFEDQKRNITIDIHVVGK